MAIQPNDLEIITAECVSWFDDIEKRFDPLLKGGQRKFFCWHHPTLPKATSLKEIQRRYHGWRIEEIHQEGGSYLIFVAKNT